MTDGTSGPDDRDPKPAADEPVGDFGDEEHADEGGDSDVEPR